MVEVRTITDAERIGFFRIMARGFHFNATAEASEQFAERIDPARTYGAFDGAEMVGTTRSFPTELTVPGGARVDAAAVTNVTVTSTHRRRGLLTEMMRQQLDADAARGEAVAILIASEAPIYGRFGYGAATEHVLVEVDAPRSRFVRPAPAGTIEMLPDARLREEVPTVYDRYRCSQSGAIRRDDRYWDQTFEVVPPLGTPEPGQRFGVLRRDAQGAPDGYALYRIHSDWDYRVPKCRMDLDELVALSDDAYHALWLHCTSVDWVVQVRAENRPPVEPLPHLLHDPRAVRQRDRADLVWLRVLDVESALGARRYRVAERIVVELHDRFLPATGGRFAVEGGPDGARCVRTDEQPDLTLGAPELGAAYLGGTPLWPAIAAGRVQEHTPGAVDRFDRMFLTDRPPWCNTWF